MRRRKALNDSHWLSTDLSDAFCDVQSGFLKLRKNPSFPRLRYIFSALIEVDSRFEQRLAAEVSYIYAYSLPRDRSATFGAE